MDTSTIKRILIIRTDRVGDVVLSTPAITSVRKAFPDAYIAVMVSPNTEDIVLRNPYINEVIIYDKNARHRSALETLRFANWLRGKRFDLALILHTTKRVNLITFLAGIPNRVGYKRRKLDFLLTQGLEDAKRLGEKHEAEYSLDLLRSIGIGAEMSSLVFCVDKNNERKIDDLLLTGGLKNGEKFIALQPAASCRSKIWPQENFAKAGDMLIERLGVRVVLVSHQGEEHIGDAVVALMKKTPIFLRGNTSIGDLAALLKRASLFISNDSGPVHIASAVGTPVISIFGRNDKGLSPTRWGPLGEKGIALHKDVGCVKCLAHNCKKGFLCLKAISVEEVVEKAEELLASI